MAIGVVIVTFNRINKLKLALEAFSRQTVSPDYVVVVNNASTDDTFTYLEHWKNLKCNYKKYVINMTKNEGGSGGFYEGFKFAQTLNSNWIWVSDDDAFPDKDALEIAEKHLNPNYSAVCGTVINNGQIALDHRKNYVFKNNRVVFENIPKSEYSKKEFEFTCFSYVGTIINKEKLKIAGLPRKEYFIFFDDTEHSLRLSQIGKIVCAPNIKIHHNVEIPKNIISWKEYYGIRNKIDMFRRYFPKKYYLFYCSANLFKSSINIILNRDKKYNKLIRDATLDGINKNMGMNKKYKPGWQLSLDKD